MCVYIYIYIYTYTHSFSIMVNRRILNIVPCALQWFIHSIYASLCVIIAIKHGTSSSHPSENIGKDYELRVWERGLGWR